MFSASAWRKGRNTADVGIGGTLARLDGLTEIIPERLWWQMCRHRLAHVDQIVDSGSRTQDQASAMGAEAQSRTLGIEFHGVHIVVIWTDVSEFRRGLPASIGYGIIGACLNRWN